MYGMKRTIKGFDFHGFGQAMKQARNAKGWTQAQLAEKVGLVSKTVTNIESQKQPPSFVSFVRIVTLLNISVDGFLFKSEQEEDSRRKHIDILLSSLGEKELMVIEAAAEALKRGKEMEAK